MDPAHSVRSRLAEARGWAGPATLAHPTGLSRVPKQAQPFDELAVCGTVRQCLVAASGLPEKRVPAFSSDRWLLFVTRGCSRCCAGKSRSRR